VKTILESY
jgi:hypothetical protein